MGLEAPKDDRTGELSLLYGFFVFIGISIYRFGAINLSMFNAIIHGF